MPKKTKKTKKTTQKQKQKQSVHVKVHIDQSRRGKTSKQRTKQPQQYIPSINLPPPQALPIIMNAPAQPAILQPTPPQAFNEPIQANTLGTQPPRYPDYYNDEVSELGDPDIEYSQVPNASSSLSSIPSNFSTGAETTRSMLSEQLNRHVPIDDISRHSGMSDVSLGDLLEDARRYQRGIEQQRQEVEGMGMFAEDVRSSALNNFTRPRTIFDETKPDIRLGDDISLGTVESTYNNPTRLTAMINQYKGLVKGQETQAKTRQRQREQAEHMNRVRSQNDEIEGLDGTIFSFV